MYIATGKYRPSLTSKLHEGGRHARTLEIREQQPESSLVHVMLLPLRYCVPLC
jgi:hypothetical protein